jgi:levanase/fructan beta-fructosidase
MQVPIEGEPRRTKWVLKVDVDQGFIAGGSGAQYFIGDFDGYNFTVDPELGSENGDPVDYGTDFYAAVTWSDLPANQTGPLWVGWMSNHQTGKEYPTHPWRGAQSIPRTLFLFEANGKLKLGQRPIEAFDRALAEQSYELGDEHGGLSGVRPKCSAFHAHVDLGAVQGAAETFRLSTSGERLLELRVDGQSKSVSIERFRCCSTEEFAKTSGGRLNNAPAELDIYFDGYLLEIFVNGGEMVLSSCIFPRGEVTIYRMRQPQ